MITAEEINKFYPFNKIHAKFIPLLLRELSFFEMQKGEKLYSRDVKAFNTKYITKGIVHVTTKTGREKLIKSTSLQSHYPIGDANKSSTYDAIVESAKIKGFQINSTLLDHFQVWNSLYLAADPASPLRGHKSYDWVTGLLKSRSVQMLPQGNIEQMFKELAANPVSAGHEIITEGATGDYAHIIARGVAEVFKCIADGEEKVAELTSGALFGETALISKEPRSASIRMKTDGLLMRLSGEKFSALLKSHVVRWITTENAMEKISQGATLLDVREKEESVIVGVQGVVNIPVSILRSKVHTLDSSRSLITCSNMSSRCAGAAFTLATMGFDVYALQGGIKKLIKAYDS